MRKQFLFIIFCFFFLFLLLACDTTRATLYNSIALEKPQSAFPPIQARLRFHLIDYGNRVCIRNARLGGPWERGVFKRLQKTPEKRIRFLEIAGAKSCLQQLWHKSKANQSNILRIRRNLFIELKTYPYN